ncbi:osmotically-inducible protein OsmY [Candidatus Williamhamiltonella defendens]|uniref:Periplasmic protein n=1 Tax=Hamiltonella defensa subsp. Acyrthosiphon pisum (strain 5AT) TaxID=572265 RepID=C4K710_HAMD5|nr:division/outer membrane stress-associated lipid-binding lipoprotein [Candidatus Hamiltonella defensa]ACQ68353.1 putative periplasmic protein [Candidatus Hamiltonella defensa 5AT (Acyrthosiphon pisum)]ATW22913.1 osmotically-inducible protein OsmY [Candidatus Hamiltonella defensa]
MKINLAAIVLSSVILQGCVGAVLIGAAAVATKSAVDPRTIGTQVDDSTLELRVINAINKDPKLKKEAKISVTAYQGKILLTGEAQSSELSERAKAIVAKVEGVSEIYNEIRQGRPVDLATTSSDIWITTKVRSQLLSILSIKSSKLKVVTENGEVFLLGLLTRKEGESAAEIASKVSGVKHVTTAFTYVK